MDVFLFYKMHVPFVFRMHIFLRACEKGLKCVCTLQKCACDL